MKILHFALLLALPLVLRAEPPRPNILFIVADDMGYADAGFMGATQTRTPRLDALAKAGAVLKSHYVQPVCSPTRSTIMTGRHVFRTGVYTIVRPGAEWGLPLAERTLPQALREAGYETAIVGKWHLGEFKPEYLPTRRGFEHQYGHWFGAIDYFTHKRDNVVDWHRNDEPCADEGYSTHLLAKEAVRLVREKKDERPLFLYMPFNAVHGPHQVPARYTEPFDKLSGTRKIYAGMLAAMDEAIGQVVDALEQRKMLTNTLVVFTSDNGGPGPGKVTDNGPLRAGKGTIYEGGLRGCAFASWPGRIPAGQRIDEPLHAVDWYPTLLKLAGASTNQPLPVDGRDLWPVLTGHAKSPHDVLPLWGTTPKRMAIRCGDWKLLLNASEKDAEEEANDSSGDGTSELYNLADDVGEKHDLAATHPGKVKELRAQLDGFIKESVPMGNPAPTAAKKRKETAR